MKMVRYLLFLLLLAAAPIVASGKQGPRLPPPFQDLMHARYDGSYYDRQANAWGELAEDKCADEDAWYHYYKSARYSNLLGSGTHDLQRIVRAANDALPQHSFVRNYLRFAAEQKADWRWDALLKAHALAPDRPEAYSSLATYYEINGWVDERNEILLKLMAQDPLPAGVMDYNHNQLQSVDQGGILLTQGDVETYPSWMLQAAYGIRTDVSVISLSLMQYSRRYLNQVFVTLGVSPLAESVPTPTVTDLIGRLATQRRPVFLAATAQGFLAQLPANHLYLTGLAFRYSTQPVDNLGALTQNYISRWRTEALRTTLAEGPGQRVADQLNQNYLPALFELQNNEALRDQIIPLVRQVAHRAGLSDQVSDYLAGNQSPRIASKTPGVKAKNVLKNIAFIPAGTLVTHPKPKERLNTTVNSFYLQEVEVSNADYQLFLEDLLRQRRFDLLDSVAVAPVDIAEHLPDSLLGNRAAKQLNGSDPAFADHPVVNISYRAAQLYARWLGEAYNSDPKRKDQRNVRFRLPTRPEFIFAARAGKQNAPFPWGGPHYRNSRGCLLANFNTFHPDSKRDFADYKQRIGMADLSPKQLAKIRAKLDCDIEDDGGLLTVAVSAYYPNDFGLYNMSGNAAEMLHEEGQTMGGSWFDPPHKMQVEVMVPRELPHPSTGFRLVMEYLN